MELLMDYDFVISYHLGKVNLVAQVLSRKSVLAASIIVEEWRLGEQLDEL